MITKPWKPQFILDEEKRREDAASLKFGAGLPEFNKFLQGIPGGLEGAIQRMNKGRDWQPDPENFNKLVNKNPVLKKAWTEFDTGSRQWTGEQLGKIKEGRKALDKWTYSNLDKATGAVGEYNPIGKLSDAFTDIGNMVTGKYGATGPAKDERAWLEEERRKTNVVEESDRFNTNVQASNLDSFNKKTNTTVSTKSTNQDTSGDGTVPNQEVTIKKPNESTARNSVRQNKYLLGTMDQLTLEATDYGANPERAPNNWSKQVPSISDASGGTSPTATTELPADLMEKDFDDPTNQGNDKFPEGGLKEWTTDDPIDKPAEFIEGSDKVADANIAGKTQAIVGLMKAAGIGQPKKEEGTGQMMGNNTNIASIIPELDPYGILRMG